MLSEYLVVFTVYMNNLKSGFSLICKKEKLFFQNTLRLHDIETKKT